MCHPVQACQFKFRLRERELISCFLSAAALAVCCFEGRLAGLDATETENELSQPKFEFAGLNIKQSLNMMKNNFILRVTIQVVINLPLTP